MINFTKKNNSISIVATFFVIACGAPQVFSETIPAEAAALSKNTHLTYEQAVSEGLQFNLDILAAKYSVPIARADEITAGLWNNPAVLIDTVFQPFNGNWNQTNNGGPKQYDLIFSYPMDLSGKRQSAEKSAHEATRIAEAGFEDSVRQKILQIRLAYIDVMTFQHQKDLSIEKTNELKKLVTTIENRIGHKDRLPLLQVRAQLAQDQAALDSRQKENALRSAKTTLAILLGRPAEESAIEVSTGLRDFKLLEIPNREKVIQFSLDTRPDLQALKLSLSKSQLDRNLANAQMWDNFNLTAGLSSQGPTDANPNDPASNAQGRAISWNAGITIPLPVLNRNQGNKLKAALAGEQAEKQIASLKLSISQELGDILDQIKTNHDLIVDYESKQLKNARLVRDSQQKVFGTGSNALLDYLDAINAYVSTLSAYYDTVGDYRRSVAKLNASAGKDLMQ